MIPAQELGILRRAESPPAMHEEAQHENQLPRGAAWRGLGAACVLGGLFVGWGFGHPWAAPAVSEHGLQLDGALQNLGRWMGLALCLALAALGFALGLGWKPKLERGAEWALALFVIAMVGLCAVQLQRLPAPVRSSSEAYEVEIIGQQFEWSVRYPGPDGVLGRVQAQLVHVNRNPAGLDAADPAAMDDVWRRQVLWLPLGEPCVLRLRSLDVLHSFNVEDFRIRREVLPGYPRALSFTPTQAGVFEMSCAALCGLGHYRMSGKIIVAPRDELEQWLAKQEPWL